MTMQATTITVPEMKFIGLTTHTSFTNETSPDNAKIPTTIQRFYAENLIKQIPSAKNPSNIISAYTDYKSDEYGEYRYFYGVEVENFDSIPENLTTLTIPTRNFQQFTTPIGKMPQVVIEAWQHIWQLDEAKLGGKRDYQIDFELYDHRAQDPSKSSLDIYIGTIQA